MDYKSVLNKCKELIINDIRGDIYEFLKTRRFINEDQFDLMNNPQLSNETRNGLFFERLLTIIDENVFEELLSKLGENYWWVAQCLRQEADKNSNRLRIKQSRPPDRRQDLENDRTEKVLREGGTPLHHLSRLCVPRRVMMDKLKKEIIDLKPGKFLVLHGMCGSGKSSLAMEVLKDHQLVFNHLQGNVFWLSEPKTIEKIHERLVDLISVGDGEIEPTNHETQIAQLIKKKKLEEALIVFDDVVSDPELVNYIYKFNCKKLIISHYEDIVSLVPSKEVKLLKIDFYLNEEESFTLLAQASGLKRSDLPEEAREIIQLTGGFPYLLHHIAMQIERNREAYLNKQMWKEMATVLSRERRGKEEGYIDFRLKKLYNVLDDQLEKLRPEMKRYYEMLAVFQSNINFNTKMFATMWSMNEMSVMNVVDEFEKQSLIAKKRHPHRVAYVYGIHDVQLYYLRNKKKETDRKELHNELIKKYSEKCGGEFWKLPVDNYIHFYLGYHLVEAGRLDLFQLFVNLKFVSAKIRAVGATDLLHDYEKYGNYIATEGNEQLFNELKEFVRHYGHILHQSNDINIIQLGLQQKESSAIFESAKALALKNPDKIFMNFEPKHKLVDDNSGSLSFREPNVTVACFSDQSDYAFIARSDGRIYKKRLDRIYSTSNSLPIEHKKGIILLTLSPNKRYLLSVCQDRELRVWDVMKVDYTEFDQKNNNNGTLKNGDRTPSPPLMQEGHCPIFYIDSAQLKSDDSTVAHDRPITCIKFSPTSEHIVTCSDDNELAIWKLEQNIQLLTVKLRVMFRKKLPSVARCCAFSLDGKTVLVGCDNNSLVAIAVDHGTRLKTFRFDSAIKCLHTVMGVNGTHPPIEGHSDFVLVLSNKVEVVRMNNSQLPGSGTVFDDNENFEFLCSWSFDKSQESFITRSWVPDNGAFIALTTSMHCVSLFNLANGHLQRKYDYEADEVVMGIDLFMNGETSYMLVLCQDEIHREKVELSPNDQASKFCVAPLWGGDQQPTMVVPCISGFKIEYGTYQELFYKTFKAINVFKLGESFWWDLQTNVTSCHIDRNETRGVIGTDCGTVQLFDLDTNDATKILEFKDSKRNPSLVVLVRIFVIENVNLIVGIDNKHLVKISYKSDVIEYQATSKVKGVWYCFDSNELILVELNQQIKVCKITNRLETDVDSILTNGDNNDPLEVRCCDFSKTSYLAVATSKMLKMFNVVAKSVDELSFNQTVNCCGFSPDGRCIALGFANGAIEIYNVQLELMNVTKVTSSVKRVCIGNEALVFGALSSNRIHVGRLLSDGDGDGDGVGADYRIGCTEINAKHLIKAVNNDCFLTIDERSKVYRVSFYNSFDLSDRFSALNITNPAPAPARPKLRIKKKHHATL